MQPLKCCTPQHEVILSNAFPSSMLSLYLGFTKPMLRDAAFEQNNFCYFCKFTMLGNLDLQNAISLSKEVRGTYSFRQLPPCYVLMCSLFQFPSTVLCTFCPDYLRQHAPNLQLPPEHKKKQWNALPTAQFTVQGLSLHRPPAFHIYEHTHMYFSVKLFNPIIFAKWRRDSLCPFPLHFSRLRAHKWHTVTQDWILK